MSERQEQVGAREVLTPLMRPWHELPDQVALRARGSKRTFWQRLSRFFHDYNCY